MRRAGLEVPTAVDPWAAEAAITRTRWSVVVWSAGRHEGVARDLIARITPVPPVILVAGGGPGATTVSEALAAGFADVATDDAGRGELVARALAVVRRGAAERLLAREADMFRELAEAGRDLLVRQAPDGTIRYASAGARELLGWDPGDLVGRRAAQILPPEALDAVVAPVVHRVRRRDAGHVWMETTARVVHDSSGRVREIQTSSRDVSGRVRAEAERAAVMRVTAAVAEGVAFERIAQTVAREAAVLVGGESGAVVRFHGDEGMVLGAAGPLLRAGDRMPVAAAGDGALVAPVVVDGAPWGVVLAGVDGLAGRPEGTAGPAVLLERLQRLAPLVSLAVSNSRGRERLVALATTDPLTGLANHGAFHERLAEEVERSGRSGSPLTLVTIDLDHFKRVNDTHGHLVGDDVLREVARRLRDCARRGDITARVGGEELGWLLPATDVEQGMEAAERLRERIAGTPFPVAGRVTASFGVAALGPRGGADLAHRADQALYRAKEGGRDACVMAPKGNGVMEALFE